MEPHVLVILLTKSDKVKREVNKDAFILYFMYFVIYVFCPSEAPVLAPSTRSIFSTAERIVCGYGPFSIVRTDILSPHQALTFTLTMSLTLAQ